ncbi:MAG TPA: HAD hydrolase family protein [Anaerolineae bacterium]|nr:HAD hydrolase family protein [Anaerolineae bacterium]
MIDLQIPGREIVQLQYAVFDVNGTLAIGGVLIDGVEDRIALLRRTLEVRLITADTHGRQTDIDRQLKLKADRLTPGDERQQKAEYVRQLGAPKVVSIGNGANDVEMLKAAAIGIAVIGREGVASEAVAAADVVMLNVLDVIDLLLNPKRLVATLRQ